MFVTLPFVVRTVQPVLQELDPEVEEAAHSLGASQTRTFVRVILPNILPGILSGVALAFAKAVGEFGSLVIITGNIPFQTEVSSVHIFGRIESGDSAGAAAVATVLLGISFLTLLSIGVIRHYARGTTDEARAVSPRPALDRARLPRGDPRRPTPHRLLAHVPGRVLRPGTP
jgi:sulfate transport system permease protein